MRRHSLAGKLFYDVTPALLGLLLLGYMLDAIFLRHKPGLGADVYKGLLTLSFLLGLGFSGILAGTWLQTREVPRSWLILLLTTLMITMAGFVAHWLALPPGEVVEQSEPAQPEACIPLLLHVETPPGQP